MLSRLLLELFDFGCTISNQKASELGFEPGSAAFKVQYNFLHPTATIPRTFPNMHFTSTHNCLNTLRHTFLAPKENIREWVCFLKIVLCLKISQTENKEHIISNWNSSFCGFQHLKTFKVKWILMTNSYFLD